MKKRFLSVLLLALSSSAFAQTNSFKGFVEVCSPEGVSYYYSANTGLTPVFLQGGNLKVCGNKLSSQNKKTTQTKSKEKPQGTIFDKYRNFANKLQAEGDMGKSNLIHKALIDIKKCDTKECVKVGLMYLKTIAPNVKPHN